MGPRSAFSTFLVATLWAARPALACECEQANADQAMRRASAIFEARVLEPPQDKSGVDAPIAMRVTRSFKGNTGPEVSLGLPTDEEACAPDLKPGHSYLVYAIATEGAPDSLRLAPCSRTRPMAEASEDLVLLGMGVVPFQARPLSDSQEESPTPAQRGGCASCSAAGGAPLPPGPFLVATCLLGLLTARGWRRGRRRRS